MQNQEFNNADYPPPLAEQSNEPAKNQTASINPTPENPPWGGWTAIGVWIASVLFLIVLGNLFLLPYMMQQNLAFTSQEAIYEFVKNDPTAVFLQVVSTIPAHLLTLLLAWAVITRFNKFSFWKTVGWEKGGFLWRHYFVIMAGIFAVSSTVSYFAPEQDNEIVRMLKVSNAVVYAFAFIATFTAPLVEEVVYRGIMYAPFQRAFGVAPAVLLVTAIFASVHFYQYWGSPSTLFLICFLSLVLTTVRARAKSLYPSFVLHTLINGIQAIFMVAATFAPRNSAAAASEPSAALIRLFYSIFY